MSQPMAVAKLLLNFFWSCYLILHKKSPHFCGEKLFCDFSSQNWIILLIYSKILWNFYQIAAHVADFMITFYWKYFFESIKIENFYLMWMKNPFFVIPRPPHLNALLLNSPRKPLQRSKYSRPSHPNFSFCLLPWRHHRQIITSCCQLCVILLSWR